MNSSLDAPLQVLLVIALVMVGGYVAIKLLGGLFWLLGRVFRGIGWFFRHIFEFVAGMLRDALRLVGCVLAAIAYAPALLASMVFLRRSAAMHYLRALRAEGWTAAGCVYRLAFGHVLHLLCLDAMTEGLEQRVPEVIARAPGPDRPGSGPATFAGYRVTGALQGGGSGARLHLAEPDADKRRQLERVLPAGARVPAHVVIKSFSLDEGSTLPQIVRENRALAAARDLGLVLEHELTATRFHYVMPFVPGDDLVVETARLHAASGKDGLDDRGLQRALGLADDLLTELQRFHKGGLWHKDVKPSNIIVSDGRAHLVDFGLITPLRSAMTLTTHGTEYFRDPEMVRLALRGVKVHEVDGIKFDVYGAGAVLYSLIENSFPAHGSLSRLSRRCPEALRWIVRRAMADLGHRYASAAEMLADLRLVSSASDPFLVRPADLPSLRRSPDVAEALVEASLDAAAAAAAAGTPRAAAFARPAGAAVAAAPGSAAMGGSGAPGSSPAVGSGTAVAAAAGGLAPAGGFADASGRTATTATAQARPATVMAARVSDPQPARSWRPLSAPYGEHRMSRKAFAAILLVGLVFANVLMSGDDSDDGYASREPTANRADLDRPLVTALDAPSEDDTAEADAAAVPAVLLGTGDATFQMLEPVSLDRLPAAPEGSLTPPLPQPPRGVVLVLDDLPANAEPARVAAVRGFCERLTAARYALLGVPTPEAALPAEAEIELLAGARSAAGLSDPSDPEAVRRLSAFLAAQAATLDAVLWIGRAEGVDPVHTRVITRSEDVARSISRVLGGRAE